MYPVTDFENSYGHFFAINDKKKKKKKLSQTNIYIYIYIYI